MDISDLISKYNQNKTNYIISDKQKLEKYYLQKSKAVSQIKIDNIRLSKQGELRKEKHEKIIDLKKQSNLFPHLDCIQIAKINFG